MVGDYGFDPLRIGVNSDLIRWSREAELTHGRWAMAAVTGILFTDLIGYEKCAIQVRGPKRTPWTPDGPGVYTSKSLSQ
jgi:hypothetical protein